MSDRRKYVIQSECIPFVCSGATSHDQLCRYGGTSAGFFDIRPSETKVNELTGQPYLEVHCWGKSISLKLDSNPEHDAAVLERLFNGD